MAIGSTCAWEVRASSGNDNNGGGYIPGSSGTDFSQQNSPQYALTSIASSGAGNTFLTALAAADMVGNILQTISGTNYTIGFFQITSVVVGVSVTCATNNASTSICTGVGASGVINIGGALATITKVLDATAYRPSNTIYCKGSFTTTAALMMTLVSTGIPTSFIGYTTTRTDNGQATWTTATNSIKLVDPSSSQSFAFFNITFSSTAGTRGDGFHPVTSDCSLFRFVNCVFDGFNIALNGHRTIDYGINGLFCENCDIKNSISVGVYNTFWTTLFGCFLHANGSWGFQLDTNSASFLVAIECAFYSNGSGGAAVAASGNLPATRSSVIAHCVFSTNTGPGLSGDANLTIVNNIFDRNTTYGIDLGAGAAPAANVTQWNNAFYSNTTASRRTSGIPPAPYNDITLTAEPYVTVGTDFNLNNLTGGGAACRQAGFPGITRFGITGYASVGAFQPKKIIINDAMTGGF